MLACYASAHGYTLVDRRLYLPRAWCADEHPALRAACGVPTEVTFRTRPALAVEMITALHERGSLPFRWVLGAESVGVSPPFLDQVAGLGLG